MFKNKLFLKILIVFLIPVVSCFFLIIYILNAKVSTFDKLKINENNFNYISEANQLIIKLKDEQDLSLKYISNEIQKEELRNKQLNLEELFIILEQESYKIGLKINLYKEKQNLYSIRKRLSDKTISKNEIITSFTNISKEVINNIYLIKFENISDGYEHFLFNLFHHSNNMTNTTNISKIINEAVLNANKNTIKFNKDLLFSIVIVCIFLFLFLILCISLMFISKNIIENEFKVVSRLKMNKEIYEMLNLANNYLMKTFDKSKLFSNICELLSENKLLKFSFIYDDLNKTIFAKDGVLKNSIISHVDKNGNFSSENLISKTIKYDTNFIINNFKEKNISVIHEEAKNLEINSMATFPIKKFNKIVAVLKIYSTKLDFFDLKNQTLFEKLTKDISYCLERIEYEDIKKQQENDLKLASFAFDSLAPMIITNKDINIIKANQAFCKALGYSREELIGKNPRIFKTWHQDKDFVKDLWNNINNYGIWNGDIYNKTSLGNIVAFKTTITVVKDENGKIINYIAQYMDISEQKNREKILEFKATHDNLTGLPNRFLLTDRIEQAIIKSKRYKNFCGLIFIDIDNFKTVNDTLGHDAGDILLINISKKIKDITRDEDTISRIGGDEFIVLIDSLGTNEDYAKKSIILLANKIKNSLTSITHIEGNKNITTASIGIILFNHLANNSRDLIKRADKAMYIAKKQGKDSIEIL